jgi:hypothetical protein
MLFPYVALSNQFIFYLGPLTALDPYTPSWLKIFLSSIPDTVKSILWPPESLC